jgi:hypothetical protein
MIKSNNLSLMKRRINTKESEQRCRQKRKKENFNQNVRDQDRYTLFMIIDCDCCLQSISGINSLVVLKLHNTS